MNTDFSFDFVSDTTFEEITVEVSYQGQILCRLNKDEGVSEIVIDFFCNQRVLLDDVSLNFKYNDFIEALEYAKKELIDA